MAQMVDAGYLTGTRSREVITSFREEGEKRALMTNDVADFSAICRAWAADGRSHSGVIFTSDASLPRNRATIGRYVDALDALMGRNPGDDDFRDRTHWL